MKKYLHLVFVLLCKLNTFGQTEKPNIIFILTDDQRYDMLGCTGNDLIQTPHIDSIAAQGTLFTNAHVTSAICTPSRASIFLSQFERKHGVNFNSGTSVSNEAWEQAYPVVLRKHGYYTGYIGKNHVPVGKEGYQTGYMEQTFDYWYAGHKHLGFYPKGRHSIFKAANSDTQIEILDEGVTDFFSNEHKLEGAKHFIDERPSDKPFFLNICFNLPHDAGAGTMRMLETDPDIYKTLYRDLDIPLPKNYVEHEHIVTPKLPPSIHFAEEIQTGYSYTKKPDEVKERTIRQMQAVTGIDKLVGNLRATLKENNLDGNTIIIFSSDHGLFMGEYGLGGKSLCYEICTHVPLIVYNPIIKPKARGQKNDQLVQSIDIAPTILSYAGIEKPDSFQGKDLSFIINGKDKPVRDFLYTENLWSTQFGNPRCESVQDKTWKYIRYYKNENLRASAKIAAAKMLDIPMGEMLYKQHDPDIALYRTFIENPLKGEPAVYEELYNLKEDSGELKNIAGDAKYRLKLEEMRKIWAEKIKYARGEGNPKVYRYTKDSSLED
ncbi:sulfatase-like hydrolase/transferase [Flavivirga amylovorans]|uniref:Sulfatase-like hydrolase/transferase n=1 Tax=Flavivirga amylovorans TaxID=870486 RepID=A0ABT8WYM7_9FLAO|nr:sulfatase-like hydrolase/transferase [Flavivirga amylovorans]MDO5986573.1 sulfatase-like hydrolase/transferase [Flavivirga amylovorans]